MSSTLLFLCQLNDYIFITTVLIWKGNNITPLILWNEKDESLWSALISYLELLYHYDFHNFYIHWVFFLIHLYIADGPAALDPAVKVDDAVDPGAKAVHGEMAGDNDFPGEDFWAGCRSMDLKEWVESVKSQPPDKVQYVQCKNDQIGGLHIFYTIYLIVKILYN